VSDDPRGPQGDQDEPLHAPGVDPVEDGGPWRPPPAEIPGFRRPQAWAPQHPGNASAATIPPAVPPAMEPATADAWDEPPGVELFPSPYEAEMARAEAAAAAAAARRRRNRALVREIVETGLLAIVVFLAVRASFQNFKVDGLSMSPTLDHGQFLIVNKLVYAEVDVASLAKFIPFFDAGDRPKRHLFHGPERGDIIVLHDPRQQGKDLIKRVIGLPGETIEIVDGVVYINGYRLEEPYITSPWGGTLPRVTIPEGEYFVMGDNRSNSLDSRSPSVGLIPEELIIGKALLSYWPLRDFGLAPNGSPRLTEQRLVAAP
jgi:signal peptidase I